MSRPTERAVRGTTPGRGEGQRALAVRQPARARTVRAGLAGIALLIAAAAGCTPKIGDACILSTDCSTQGDRTCDTSQANGQGYCTIVNCTANGCPDKAACVLFESSLPGCGFNSREPSRVGRTWCMAACEKDSDCRASEGYVCADPKSAPWSATILDDDTGKRVCIIAASFQPDAGATSSDAVCSPFANDAGTLDASSAYDAGNSSVVDAGSDAAAPTDAGADASSIVDATVGDAADAGSDADAGIRDAADEG